MEEENPTLIPATTSDPPKLTFLNSLGRVIFSILLLLASVICAVSTVIVAICTIRLIPNFIFFSMDNPYAALFGTLVYIGAAFTYCVLCILSFTLARNLIKNQPIPAKYIVAYIIFIVLAVLLQYAGLPLFGSTFTA